MSMKLDPKEILKYLNEVGYRNVTSQQLKEFIRDLKTLIKHDLKKETQKANQENIPPRDDEPYYIYQNKKYDTYQIDSKLLSKQLSLSDDTVGSSSSVNSQEKSTPEKEQIISVEFLKPAVKKSVGAECNCIKTDGKFPSRQQYSATSINNNNSRSASKSTFSEDVKIDTKVGKSKVSDQHRINILKPRKSFIKPRAPTKFVKSDPVALYQQYKAEWKKQKLPGEDKHYDLRWAIRERMLGEPNLGPYPSYVSSADKSSKRSNRF